MAGAGISVKEGNYIVGKTYRLTLLTDSLIRFEYEGNGRFVDEKTQLVVNRQFPEVKYRIKETESYMELFTKHLHVIYDKKKFSRNGLSVTLTNDTVSGTWHYGEPISDLRGTTRTLDLADGPVPLGPGLLSRGGFTVIDDSHSVLLTEDNWFKVRETEEIDFYFFGYGHRYQECLKDFYGLSGETPLIPRFTLGNWWSRYHKYTEEEYMEVVQNFEKEKVPLTVGIIDMDWHLVDIDPKYGSGWTGFTWNKELFPDYKRFLNFLHEHGLRTSMNLHPADGIRAHEVQYPKMASYMGVNKSKEEPVEFDLTNPKFVKGFFDLVMHPYEEDGVDFWWLDWQQGSVTRVPGLDPLWLLNHIYYEDSQKNGKRGLTFSRYAELGSHRFPLGFSGDAAITWKMLDFEPYFTANASNAGYGWWSHDIGGHHFGQKDEELTARWVQFGVFSPIMRLHSTDHPYIFKEPWKFHDTERNVIDHFMRLRHAMIPYLYTMSVLANEEGQPLVRPMYYLHPEEHEAYEVPNEYYFGTEMIVCPLTKKADESGLSSFDAWLPEGEWTDMFTGLRIRGSRRITLSRDLTSMPVLLKAGAIVPLTDVQKETADGKPMNDVGNPTHLDLLIVPGADNRFELMEDDADNGNFSVSAFTWDETDATFIIWPAEGSLEGLPEKRSWKLRFYGIQKTEVMAIAVNEIEEMLSEGAAPEISYDEEHQILTVEIGETDIHSSVLVKLMDCRKAVMDKEAAIDRLFSAAQGYTMDDTFKLRPELKKLNYAPEAVTVLDHFNLPERIKAGIREILLA